MGKENNTFYLNSGKTVKTLKALAKELRGMSGDVYDHHVNPAKNDFEAWVKHSLENEDLSLKIKGHMNKIDLELEILRHLVEEPDKSKKPSSKKKKVVAKKTTSTKKAKKKPSVKKKISSKK